MKLQAPSITTVALQIVKKLLFIYVSMMVGFVVGDFIASKVVIENPASTEKFDGLLETMLIRFAVSTLFVIIAIYCVLHTEKSLALARKYYILPRTSLTVKQRNIRALVIGLVVIAYIAYFVVL